MQNAYAEYGTFCHSLMDRFALGELAANKLAEEYDSGYDNAVVHPFPSWPKNLANTYYQNGYDYFSQFTGFGDEYEIVATEQEFVITIGKYKFKGIMDLLLRHKITGAYVLVDHKSKKYSGLKSDLEFYQKQLYAYAIYIFEKYGVYPDELWFNVFREQKFIKLKFDMQAYEDTKQWVIDTVEEIITNEVFIGEWPQMDDMKSYFCKFICGVRLQCLSEEY
jgi:hypothetical protein